MPDERCSELIYRIYNTVNAPDTWQEVLADVATDLGASHFFIAARASVDAQPFAFIEHGFSHGHFDQYHQHYYKVDVWTKALAQHEPNQFRSSHEVYDDRAFLNSEIYHDFARPADIRHGLGCLLVSGDSFDPPMMTELALMRGGDLKHFDESEKRRAQHYVSHFEQALQLGRQMQQLTAQQRAFAGLFAAQTQPALICDYHLRVYEHNHALDGLAQNGELLGIGCERKLTFVDERNQSQLEACIAGFRMATFNSAESFSVVAGGVGYRVKVSPWLYTGVHLPGQQQGALLVQIQPLRTATQLSPGLIMCWTALSAAEAEVVAHLCEGTGLAQIAELRKVSLGTVRQQLKSAMHKVGCHSQAQLIARILTLSV